MPIAQLTTLSPGQLHHEVAQLLAETIVRLAADLRFSRGEEALRERRRLMDSTDWLDLLISERMRLDAEQERTT